MCFVSGVIDYGRNLPTHTWTPDTWSQFQEIINKLDKLDKKMDQPDCDPLKRDWMQEVDERLRKLEERHPAAGLAFPGAAPIPTEPGISNGQQLPFGNRLL